MIRMGDWMKVQIGSVAAIGYVSNLINFSWHGERVELTKVALIVSGELEWKKPTITMYDKIQLEPADNVIDQYQDKSAMIDLALLTGDKIWFKELTGQAVGASDYLFY